jgi:glycine dehydrogenase subunit 1
MAYIPNADGERAQMLSDLELTRVEELFGQIPERLLLKTINLPEPLSEVELGAYFRALGRLNSRITASNSFLGGGAWRRFSPAIVNAIISRPDFYTTYTPYQAEASQGLLEATYEFQSMIALLTGLDVANASLYDGATALTEASLMAVTHTGRRQVVIAGRLHPEYVQVLQTYAQAQDYQVEILAAAADGRIDLEALRGVVSAKTAAVILQQPNFFGILEDPQPVSDIVHRAGGLLIASIDPISVAILRSPGDYRADIATGDGQPLGIPLSYGGPYVGFIACREALLRRMPGRLVGATVDAQGRRGFVLTLQAREQHIRREGATSNITTNHALMALAATVYLAWMGATGLRRLAELCVQRAHALAARIVERDGYQLAFDAPFLWEFVVRTPRAAQAVQDAMVAKGTLPGLPLQRFDSSLANALLVAVTEMNDPSALDRYIAALP